MGRGGAEQEVFGDFNQSISRDQQRCALLRPHGTYYLKSQCPGVQTFTDCTAEVTCVQVFTLSLTTPSLHKDAWHRLLEESVCSAQILAANPPLCQAAWYRLPGLSEHTGV